MSILRGSSVVEQLAVNQWVVGSNPTRGGLAFNELVLDENPTRGGLTFKGIIL